MLSIEQPEVLAGDVDVEKDLDLGCSLPKSHVDPVLQALLAGDVFDNLAGHFGFFLLSVEVGIVHDAAAVVPVAIQYMLHASNLQAESKRDLLIRGKLRSSYTILAIFEHHHLSFQLKRYEPLYLLKVLFAPAPLPPFGPPDLLVGSEILVDHRSSLLI